MKTEEILAQIDKLKLMVILDKDIPDDLDEYHKWVDKMQGRISCIEPKPFGWIPMSNTKYSKYKTLTCLVEDLYYKEHSGERDYHENKKEVRRIIAEVIAMTMFIEEKS